MLAVGMPMDASLGQIYGAYLGKHFGKFKASIHEQVQIIIKATLSLHAEVVRNFRKTAQNFHYEFNVRHLTNVFQGLLNAKVEAITEPEKLVKLWVHEAERIYGDRLVSHANLAKYRELAGEICSKSFPKYNLKKFFNKDAPELLVFANFVGGLDDKLYDVFPSGEAMKNRLTEGLNAYNELNAVMNLVLFEDAMKHVCKIARIISADQGHALLVGVGGSGKQSLTRLAASICAYRTVGIMISSTYGLTELKVDLQRFFMLAGVKDEGICFLFTEGQITKEKFLVSLNDLLSSGEIADLFAEEEIDGIVNSVRSAVKGEGIPDTKENCMGFFYSRVRRNLHMSLCFSPVGDGFRTRATRFPAIVTATVIDWFYDWPQDALLSVAEMFLAEVEMDSEEIRAGIVKFMPYSFLKVGEFSSQIMIEERRPVYTTPKSFLELITLFKSMLGKKKGELEA
jgi:dynein heavy chain